MSADASGSHKIRIGASAPSEGQVGRYRLLSELGRGGTANVYLAIARGEVGVSKLVVLKALLPELAEDPSAVAMFMEEARLAAQLNHPNVVQTYDVGVEGDRSVIVMEFLEGRSLAQIIRHCEGQGQRFPQALHLRVLIDVLEGLHYAHELRSYEGVSLSLVHRDISPQNVFVTYDGQVKILDFGIAKAAWSTQTATGVMKGKLSYMAPEQMTGASVDRRADIYSFGCMLWAAATGVKLWSDCTEAQVVRRVLNGRIPSPKTVNPDCPDELEAITMKALRFERDERHATALELQAELERFVENATVVLKRRELGQFVSNLFAEARHQLRAGIEREVASLDARALVAASEIPREEGSGPAESTRQPPPHEATGSARRRLLLVAGASVVVALGATTWLGRGSSSRVSSELPRSNVAPSGAIRAPGTASAPARQPAIAVTPPIPAAIPSEMSPADAGAIQNGKQKTRPGPRAVTNLRSPAPAASSAPAPTASAPGANDAESKGELPSDEGCENPFYIDPDGIKRVRSQCL
jgi:serine/threonine-protein kinase